MSAGPGAYLAFHVALGHFRHCSSLGPNGSHLLKHRVQAMLGQRRAFRKVRDFVASERSQPCSIRGAEGPQATTAKRKQKYRQCANRKRLIAPRVYVKRLLSNRDFGGFATGAGGVAGRRLPARPPRATWVLSNPRPAAGVL